MTGLRDTRSGLGAERQFLAIGGNPDTQQLQEWWRNQRGTKKFLAQLEDELLIRAGLKHSEVSRGS